MGFSPRTGGPHNAVFVVWGTIGDLLEQTGHRGWLTHVDFRRHYSHRGCPVAIFEGREPRTQAATRADLISPAAPFVLHLVHLGAIDAVYEGIALCRALSLLTKDEMNVKHLALGLLVTFVVTLSSHGQTTGGWPILPNQDS